MTRKDYILIAACLKAAQKYNPWPVDDIRHGAKLMQSTIAKNLADALGRDNPRFDRERFFKACGVQS